MWEGKYSQGCQQFNVGKYVFSFVTNCDKKTLKSIFYN